MVRSLGTPGAPAVIAKPLTDGESAWTVCDGTTTTVIAGQPDGIDRQARQPRVLVTPRSESAATTYLLYDGWRAEVDLRNPAVVWALRLDGIEPRPVSRALLDAIPEAPPIAPPHVAGAGAPGALAGLRVGTVVRMTRVDANDYFVVLADGVQRIGEVAADLIRIIDSQGSREVASVSPDAVGNVPVVNSLSVSTFPERAGTPIGAGDNGMLCARWLPDGPKTVLWVGNSLPLTTNSNPVVLVQADGEGPNVDSVVMPPGRSAYVRATALTGSGGDTGPFYLVTDSGVLFGLHDENTGKLLGVQGASRSGSLAGAVAATSWARTEQGQCASRARQSSLAAVTGRPRPSTPPRQPRRRRRSRLRRMRSVARSDPAGYCLPVVRSGVRRRL